MTVKIVHITSLTCLVLCEWRERKKKDSTVRFCIRALSPNLDCRKLWRKANLMIYRSVSDFINVSVISVVLLLTYTSLNEIRSIWVCVGTGLELSKKNQKIHFKDFSVKRYWHWNYTEHIFIKSEQEFLLSCTDLDIFFYKQQSLLAEWLFFSRFSQPFTQYCIFHLY